MFDLAIVFFVYSLQFFLFTVYSLQFTDDYICGSQFLRPFSSKRAELERTDDYIYGSHIVGVS